MTDITKSTRRTLWQGYNFAGTIDWAVDLQDFKDDGNMNGTNADDYLPPGNLGLSGSCPNSYKSLEDMAADNNIPSYCIAQYLLEFMHENFTESMKEYTDLINGGYDSKFDIYATAVAKGANSAVDGFMREHGNDYFTCVVTEETLCKTTIPRRAMAGSTNNKISSQAATNAERSPLDFQELVHTALLVAHATLIKLAGSPVAK
jgi:hypothetical protein